MDTGIDADLYQLTDELIGWGVTGAGRRSVDKRQITALLVRYRRYIAMVTPLCSHWLQNIKWCLTLTGQPAGGKLRQGYNARWACKQITQTRAGR